MHLRQHPYEHLEKAVRSSSCNPVDLHADAIVTAFANATAENIGFSKTSVFLLIENSLMHTSKAGHREGAMVRVDRKCEACVLICCCFEHLKVGKKGAKFRSRAYIDGFC